MNVPPQPRVFFVCDEFAAIVAKKDWRASSIGTRATCAHAEMVHPDVKPAFQNVKTIIPEYKTAFPECKTVFPDDKTIFQSVKAAIPECKTTFLKCEMTVPDA